MPETTPPADQTNVMFTDDILDFAYCPFALWWRKNEVSPEIVTPDTRRTGEQLIQYIVSSTMNIYARSKGRGTPPQLPDICGSLWSSLLATWKIAHLAEMLVDYSTRRRTLLDRFRSGQITGWGGKKFKIPTLSRQWQELAHSTGLIDIRKTIDANRGMAGLRAGDDLEEDAFRAPMGLADAFAISCEIVDSLKLPAPDRILGVQAPVVLDLLTTRLVTRADMIVDMGEVAAQGRPTKEGEKHSRKSLDYEIHVFDELPPSPKSFFYNLRVMALRNSLPETNPNDYQVASITVRSLRTNELEKLYPRPGTDLDILEGLARSTDIAMRAGVYVPRMAHSQRACPMDCQHRVNCFEEGGILERVNPPLAAQIQMAQHLGADLRRISWENMSSQAVRKATRNILNWLASNPALATEKAAWFFEAVAQEAEWDSFIRDDPPQV